MFQINNKKHIKQRDLQNTFIVPVTSVPNCPFLYNGLQETFAPFWLLDIEVVYEMSDVVR